MNTSRSVFTNICLLVGLFIVLGFLFKFSIGLLFFSLKFILPILGIVWLVQYFSGRNRR